MSIVELMEAMQAAGAPMEAIMIAVRAIEEERAKDAARREKRAKERRDQRARDKEVTVASHGSDCRVTVAQHGGDMEATVAPTPPEVSPKDNKSNPLPNPPSEPSLCSGSDAPRKAKRAKPKTQISEDAQPTERDRKAAEDAGLGLELFRSEWRAFRDHHRAKGSLMADWSAAWRTWLGRMPQYQPSRAGPVQMGAQKGGFAIAAMEFMEDARRSENQNQGAAENVPRLPFDGVSPGDAGEGDDGCLPELAGWGSGRRSFGSV